MSWIHPTILRPEPVHSSVPKRFFLFVSLWIILLPLGVASGLFAGESAPDGSPIPGFTGDSPTTPATGDGTGDEKDPATPFRIDNKLTIERDDKIVEIETITLFSNGKVIDFIGDNGEIIIYDATQKNFLLLDPLHRIQTELSVEEIDQFLGNLRVQLTEKKDKFCQFMFQPEFDFSRNEETGDLLFQSKWLDYQISTRSFDDPVICDQYFEFVRAYGKLNVYLNPGTLTPLAREKVNEMLRAEKRFPVKVSQTIYPSGKRLFAKLIEVKSDHKLLRRFSEEDQGRIVRAIHFHEQFPKVSFGNYYQTVTRSDPKE